MLDVTWRIVRVPEFAYLIFTGVAYVALKRVYQIEAIQGQFNIPLDFIFMEIVVNLYLFFSKSRKITFLKLVSELGSPYANLL